MPADLNFDNKVTVSELLGFIRSLVIADTNPLTMSTSKLFSSALYAVRRLSCVKIWTEEPSVHN